jgi:hypothetical protein
LAVLLTELKNYLHSKTDNDIINYNYNNCAFGLETYDYLEIYFQLLAQEVDNTRYDSIRTIHILWEHKKIMLQRLNFLHTQYNLKDIESVYPLFDDIEQKSKLLRHHLLKFTLTKDNNIIERFLLELKTIKKEEELAYEKLIEIITFYVP